jgi:RNA polymerase sigma-70 factor (ECF subfamily)
VTQPTTADARARFDQYVTPELDLLYRVAMSLTRKPSDAEDLVQDTLLRAFRAIDRFDGRYPRAWLLTIMRNAHLNHVRKKRPDLLRDPDRGLDELPESPSEPSSESEVVDTLFDATLEEALNDLPPKFREVVDLVDLGDLSYQEAADMLDVPIGTVMSRLHRGRARIRTQLERNGFDPRAGSRAKGEDR